MNTGVIKAYFLKEIKELVRSKLIIFVYLMPTMVLLLFSYGIRMQVEHIKTVIIDKDQTKLSIDFTSALQHSKYFDTKITYLPENKILNNMKKGKVDLIIIIPPSFEKRVLKGQKADIGIFVDASFPFRGSTIESYVKGVLFKTAQDFFIKKNINIKFVDINNRNLFNQSMRDENAVVPGLIGLILLIAPAILSALLIVREKENGTIFNFYSSSVKKSEFLIAKLIPVFLLHSINIFILFLWATYLFKVPFKGSFFIYWLTSEIYIVISLSIGLLVSVIAKTQIVALIATIVITIIPGFLYSGILMPISSLKGEAYIEAHIFPVMYYNHIIYDTFLIGQGFSSDKNLFYFLILIFYAILLLTLGSLFMKKELR